MHKNSFVSRHIGPRTSDIKRMLETVGYADLDRMSEAAVPKSIQARERVSLDGIFTSATVGKSSNDEYEALAHLKQIASKNQVYRSYIGTGYNGTITPGVIQRNILENPGWYTQYTPYQAEISQGRLEALLNFQTMVAELTGLPIANASLLDEATAAAESMVMCLPALGDNSGKIFFVSELCHPQTIAVVRTRAEPLGVEVLVGNHETQEFGPQICGALFQNPGTDGSLRDYTKYIEKAKAAGATTIVAADILSLALTKTPGEMGADVAIGSAQRFGVPMGFGGPHAAFLACREDKTRKLPGRIIGVSKDSTGKPGYRLSLQTREQHIRRDKASSNICTAQVLLAIMASMYAVYHGPEGIKQIAEHVHEMARLLAAGLQKLGLKLSDQPYFDTIKVECKSDDVIRFAEQRRMNLRRLGVNAVSVSIDETTNENDIRDLLWAFAGGKELGFELRDVQKTIKAVIPDALQRRGSFLTHPVFNRYHSETEMLRYIRKLEGRDLSLAHSMIPLGSCTMKLNATAEMYPVSWPEFAHLHPFAPEAQWQGYRELFATLEKMLSTLTGFDAVSLQPNAGSQGEYAGLLVIRAYHQSRGEALRNVCLIPKSAHGTNPASAALAGMKIVAVECDSNGNVDVKDLQAKAEAHAKELSCLMITYPSTHGVFEEAITQICEVVHKHGGQVYMDGANMNAQIGLCLPGKFGPDVCHLNLHKTFCIPHGGGGPGMGPICVRSHLAPFLPGHPVVKAGGAQAISAVSAAPFGSPSILPISWMYIRMMGVDGLKQATQVAILNANYVAKRLDPHFPVLYKGANGLVAHECIVDVREIKAKTGIEVEDIAKRLMDYGFHAPTISFPVPNTMMIEPTESESKTELDRFCDAMSAIREEIREIETGKADAKNNVLKHAPHSTDVIMRDAWDRPYSREKAAYPLAWVRERKFWPHVSRIDNVYGDRNLVCTCPTMESYS